MRSHSGLIMVLYLFAGISARGQSTGTAQTAGACSPAFSGHNNTVTIQCKIDTEEGKRMVEILNKILVNRIDETKVMQKLDEILAARNGPLQDCVGSNCFQGTNNGTIEQNTFGAPKLTMSDSQRANITAAMKPYSGTAIEIMCHDATDDSMNYAQQLAGALRDAGITVSGPFAGTIFSPMGISPGVSFSVGKARKDAAIVLAYAMERAGLIHASIPATLNEQDDGFRIIVAPNR